MKKTMLWTFGFMLLGAAIRPSCEASDARQILDASGVRGGLIVHLGCGDGRLTTDLHAHDGWLVQGWDAKPENVSQARQHVHSAGKYGRVSVDRLIGNQLPYIDNLVNLIVAEDLEATGISMDEVMRVLCPEGVACIQRDGQWIKTVKPRPEEIDEWTHYMHDPSGNAVAHDAVVGPPRHLQWLGSPRWSRMHDHMSSVSAAVSSGGRVFYIFDEGPRASIELPPDWKLIARDAFNGTILWKRPIEHWHTHLWPLKSGPAHLPRRIVAIGEVLYATLGIEAPVTALDASSGEPMRVYEGTEGTEEVIVDDGVLFLVVNDNPVKRFQPRGEYTEIGEIKQEGNQRTWSEEPTWVVAVNAETGDVLWKRRSVTLPLTLAVDGQRVYFHDGDQIVALDRDSGQPVWTSDEVPRNRDTFISNFAPTLVVYRDVVLFAGGEAYRPHRGGEDTMTALSAETGEKLWSASHGPSGYQSPEDVLVAGGLVWCGSTTSGGMSGVFTGRDPWTGEVKSEFAPDVETYWFHHRCYRGKATDKYLLMSRTGVEFLDIQDESWLINHWVRGACLYGVMPCNGLLYAPQHPCACYPEAKLFGFNALAPPDDSRTRRLESLTEAAQATRLEKGPAYNQPATRPSSALIPSSLQLGTASANWPTYRGDAGRSGYTPAQCPTDLQTAWETDLGGRLSSPVIADGAVYVTSVDTHQVLALDAEDGRQLWSFTAGGRVDSPPTIYDGRVLFGSADGYVYCLRAADGELAWRFRAAPLDERLVAFEQVESVWPVHGSVLVQDGVLYCVAGRSVFLDGGLRLLRLDPKTGELLSETPMDDRDPETEEDLQNRLQILNMPVGLNGILSSDGQRVYLKSQVFGLDGTRQELGPHSGDPVDQGSVQRGDTAHLFCPSGFLDGSWWHRTYWVYGRSFAGGHGGYYQAGKFAPAGRILVFDDQSVYGFGRKPQYYRWTTPLEHQLFATEKQPPELPESFRNARRGTSAMIQFEKTPAMNPAGKAVTVEAWVKADRPDGAIVARGGPAQGYALLLRGGRPRFAIRTDDQLFTVSGKRRVVGRWVHLAGVLTAEKQLQLYVDGELAGTAEAAELIASEPSQSLQIGADEGSGGVGDYKGPFTFGGTIDEVRIYHGALRAQQIEQHFAAPGSVAADGAELILACSFDDGKATDASGQGHHGAVEGAEAVAGKVGQGMQFTPAASTGRSYFVEHDWTQDLPILVRAMVLADETLFVVGPPDVMDEEEAYKTIGHPDTQAALARQKAALGGELGSVLLAISARDGSQLAQYELNSLPSWDGLASAAGSLFLTTEDGRLIRMSAN